MRQHKIWVQAEGGSAKAFGCGNDGYVEMKICVGASSYNSRLLSTVKVRVIESAGKLNFVMVVDGQTYRLQEFNQKTKDFAGIEGRVIDGDAKKEKEREESTANGFLKMVGAIALLGELEHGDDQKAANDWKERMLRAGLENRGLIMPEDWADLSEEEKSRRLNGVIKIMTEA